MTVGNYVSQFFTQIWRIFSGINVPGLGITFSSMYLGLLVIFVSIGILKSLYSIADGGINALQRSGKNKYTRKGKDNE